MPSRGRVSAGYCGKTDVMPQLMSMIASRWRESIIPDQLLGYHLLSASQLSPTERSTIISTAKAQVTASTSGVTQVQTGLNLETIENSLVGAWQDRELFERDERETRKFEKRRIKHGKSYALGEESGSDETEGEIALARTSEADTDVSSEEGVGDLQMLEQMSDADDAEGFALALQTRLDTRQKFGSARRNYRQAREHVRNIRKNRQGRTYTAEKVVGTRKGPRFRTKEGEKGKPKVNMAEALAAFRQMKSFQPVARSDLCFKCGQKGHIAKFCPKNSAHALESDQAHFVHCLSCTEVSNHHTINSNFVLMVKSEESDSSDESNSDRSQESEVSQMTEQPRTEALGKTAAPTSKTRAKPPTRKGTSSDESSGERLLKKEEEELKAKGKQLERLKRSHEIATKRAAIEKEIALIEAETRKIEKQQELEKVKEMKVREISTRKHKKKKRSERSDRSRERKKRRSRSQERSRHQKRSRTPDEDMKRDARVKRRPATPEVQRQKEEPAVPVLKPRQPDRPPPPRPEIVSESVQQATPDDDATASSSWQQTSWNNQGWSSKDWQDWKTPKNKGWYEWRYKDSTASKVPGQRKAVKDYVNYEEPVPPEEFYKTSDIVRQETDKKKERSRAELKRKRTAELGEVLDERRKLRPKRTREQIVCLPIWPSEMSEAGDKSKKLPFEKAECRSEKEILEEVKIWRDEVERLKSNKEEVTFEELKDPTTDEWINLQPGEAENEVETNRWRSHKEESDDDDTQMEETASVDEGDFDQPTRPEKEQIPKSMKTSEPPTRLKREVKTEDPEKAETSAMVVEEVGIAHAAEEESASAVRMILDTGATHSIISTSDAERLQQAYGIKELKIGSDKKFRSASGGLLETLSVATFELPNLGVTTFYVVNTECPCLLGMTALVGGSVDLASATLVQSSGRRIRLSRGSNGHLYIMF